MNCGLAKGASKYGQSMTLEARFLCHADFCRSYDSRGWYISGLRASVCCLCVSGEGKREEKESEGIFLAATTMLKCQDFTSR